MSRPKLIAFFAHPDDEAFSCAGTLAAAAGFGMSVAVVSATRGEAGQARDGDDGDLAGRRSAELARSCERMGVAPPSFLELPDGALAVHRARLVTVLRELARGERPDVWITMGPDGAYGHLDHVVCSEASREAVAEVVESTTLLHVVYPEGVFAPLRRRLAGAPVPLAPESGPAPGADYRVILGKWAARKLEAVAAHRSQLLDGDPRTFLMPGLVDALLREERFRYVAGPRVTGALASLFEAC